MKSKTNAELNKLFNHYYPGGHSNFKAPKNTKIDRIFLNKAEGSRFWDVDGKEYIDYMGGLGPNILGHKHPRYIEKLCSHLIEKPICGGSFSLASEDDVIVAEKLVRYIPCAERVKLNVTGSEAVQMAIRLARAYTGRPYFLRFGGHYHGWIDNIFGGMTNNNVREKPYPVQNPSEGFYTLGKGPFSDKEGLMIPWNDIDILEDTLKKHGQEIAIIHFEALVCNNKAQYPLPGFLERVRELCTEYGIVMSFDEIITGFRLGLSGAQGAFGVTPDICTLGKSLGGGIPVSAVAGKACILEKMRDGAVLGPGTFNGFPLAVKAIRTTLEILEEYNGYAYREMTRVQELLTSGLSEIAKRREIPMRIQGGVGIFFTLWGVDPNKAQYTDSDAIDYDEKMSNSFYQEMLNRGVAIIGNRWYPSIAHSDKDVSEVLDIADKVIANL